MAGSVRLRWLAALGSCWLLVGCLLHRPGEAPAPFDPPPGPALPAVERPAPPQPVVRPVVRSAAATDPLVKLEVGPAPPAASPREQPAKPPAPGQQTTVAILHRAVEKSPQKASQVLDRAERAGLSPLQTLLALNAGIGERELAQLSPEQATDVLNRLHDLAGRLKERASLQLGQVCFCRRIESFGQYEPLGSGGKDLPEFQAGSDGRPGERVQVYVEVLNCVPVKRQGQYETRLNSTLEIEEVVLQRKEGDERRKRVVFMNLGTCVDVSQSPRQDYFLNFQFHVPPRMPPGLYTLRVTVKDETPGQKQARVARRSLDFRVCSPAR